MSAPLADRYDLGERIGSGGFGEVRVALDRTTGQRVAVKLLADTTRESAARFAREARLIRQLAHPNTVRMLDFGQAATGPFMVLELLRGETLSMRLKRGPLQPELVMHVMLSLLGSLSEAHAHGIVHRDVKPANIFLCEAPPGQVPVVKVLDFGIAKDPHSAGATIEFAAVRASLAGARAPTVAGPGLTQADVMLGTPRYMAPEQITGAPIGPPADVYAAGLLFAELLTGWPVFAGLSEVSTMLAKGAGAQVPLAPAVTLSPFGELIVRATQLDPARRFRTAAEMLSAVSAVTAAPSPTPYWKLTVGVLVAATLLSAIAVGVALGRSEKTGGDDESETEETEETSKPKAKRKDAAAGASATATATGPKRRGSRERLGPRTVWHNEVLEFDEAGLPERLRKAGFELEKLDEHSVTAKRGNATCLATRVAGAGREICLSVHSRQSQNADVSWLLYCYENGFHLLHCYDGRGKAGAMMPTWARAYGFDPDDNPSPR